MIVPKSIDFLLPHHEVQRQERIRLFVTETSGHSSSQYWLVAVGSIFCLFALGYHFRKHIPCLSWYVSMLSQVFAASSFLHFQIF